ncbi:hypothetical protein EDB84DRAFT_1564743 [Lactarius hengduanensis]|nr:hypothetical protein EDB84DRAFT_1564743 [Lactarius hengduanensis]
MAQPSETDTRLYSPSKLTDLPLILTPSTGPLNNSGSYSQALPGPIIASGNGQPRRREGQAYWDDAVANPTVISINSSSPPAAGRSPLDSKMNSPESEEPTFPALDLTQVGPATMQAIETALAPLAEHEAGSQQLWDNVPSWPADLPPQPEVIEVRGRTTSRTPRVRSRALSNASVWSHATVESASADGSPVRFLPPSGSADLLSTQFNTALQLLKSGLLGPSYDPDALDTGYIDQGANAELDDEFMKDITDTNETLEEELARDVTEKVVGWGAYHLGAPLQMSKDHNFPTGPKTVHAAAALTITLIDAGASATRGDLMADGLTPASWTRLCLGLLAAMIRGALRSPPTLTRGTRSLNGTPDAFPKSAGLDIPLTEGGAIMLMTQQLGGLFTSYKNHPDKSYPDSYFEKLIATIDGTLDRFPKVPRVPAQESAQPSKADGPTREELREKHFHDEMERLRVDKPVMDDIAAEVRAHMFQMLNSEAMSNLDEWRDVYKFEFIEAMHTAFEAQYPGIHLGKGKARANPPPLTLSQVVRDAEPQIKQEVQLQVDARIKLIHEEIRESLGNDEPFWTGGPLRESIAQTVIKATSAQVQKDLEVEIESIQAQADEELAQLKTQCQHEYTKKLEDFKVGVWDMCKDWKSKYNNARSLHTLRDLAHKRGYALTPIDPESLQREADALAKFALAPLTIDGYELSSSPPSRAHSPVSDKPLTPPSKLNPLFIPDPNVTPTPVRVKRVHMDDLPPSSPYTYPQPVLNFAEASLWISSSPKRAVAAALPPPTPMEEDFDYALEVWAETTQAKNGGLMASDHAPAPIAQPSPLPAHNPSAPPQVAALAAQAEQPTTAPVPAVAETRPSGLVDPPLAPPAAAPEDGLARLIAALSDTISRLDAKLDAGLDAQNKRIDALLQSRDPRPKPAKVQAAKAKEAVAAPPAPNTVSAPGSAAMDEIPSRMARVDDPADEPIAELFTEGSSSLPPLNPENPVIVRQAFQPPVDKLVRLETDARGKPVPTATMPVSWAGVVTQTAAHQQSTAAAHAKQTNAAMGRTAGGRSRPETAARRTASANTEVTVIRGHGVEDALFELQLFKRAPSTFVAEIRQEVERMSQGKLIILAGRWSQKANAHNFVYTFQGAPPLLQMNIFPYRNLLVKPLMAGYVVPNDGWTHAQLRDVSTRAPDGTVHTNDTLIEELRRNAPFRDAIFCLVPHWQGSAYTVAHSEKTTVVMAYVDEGGKVSSAAVAAGTYMFNSRARLIVTGDSPSIPARSPLTAFAASDAEGPITPTTTSPSAQGTTPLQEFAHARLSKGFAPPPLVERDDPAIVPPPPAPSAKGTGKEAAPPLPEDLVSTQREPPSGSAGATTAENDFTEVRRGKRRNGQGGRTGGARKAAKLTSVVPARPLTADSAPPAKNAAAAHFTDPPPFPPWHTVPIIGEPHVATKEETLEAITRITKGSTDTTRNDDLALLCEDWSRPVQDDDPLGTLLQCIPFRFAIRYRLPLSTIATVNFLTKGKSMSEGQMALKAFEREWGEVSPHYLAQSKVDHTHHQSFILPGEVLPAPEDPTERTREITCATALISSCIAVQEFTNPTSFTPITDTTVRAIATSYNVAFFKSTNQEELWTVLADYQKSTSALLTPSAYA